MVYKSNEIAKMLSTVTNVFDVARIVDPKKWKILVFDTEGNITFDEYSCYSIWEKEKRCLNCISIRALNEKKRFTKYEFVDDQTYYVVSKPLEIEDNEGIIYECNLEIVANITDEVFFNAVGKNEFVDKILKSEKLQYIDSLTKAYNRRYYEEKIYLTYDTDNFSKNVAFIMTDLKKFKLINDNYGHDAGDEVLKSVSRVYISNVRDKDSVIRFGGDEFLIIINDCTFEIANEIVERINQSLKDVIYDTDNGLHVISNFGVAYTENFTNNDTLIASLLKEADKRMYEDKNKIS